MTKVENHWIKKRKFKCNFIQILDLLWRSATNFKNAIPYQKIFRTDYLVINLFFFVMVKIWAETIKVDLYLGLNRGCQWGNIFPHVWFQLLVCTSFPTCTVPVCIFELSVPLFPHVQFHPNMHYPFLAHVRSKLHLINNYFIKINDQKIFSRLIMVRLGSGSG